MATASRQRVGISEAGLYDPAVPPDTQLQARRRSSKKSKARHVVRHGLCGSVTSLWHFMVQMWCNDGIAHESDSGMLEHSVYTINMGVFKLRVRCFARAVGWDYVEVFGCMLHCCVSCWLQWAS